MVGSVSAELWFVGSAALSTGGSIARDSRRLEVNWGGEICRSDQGPMARHGQDFGARVGCPIEAVSAHNSLVARRCYLAIVRRCSDQIRRGGRVVEGARLERVCAGNRTVGSNPTPSAISNS